MGERLPFAKDVLGLLRIIPPTPEELSKDGLSLRDLGLASSAVSDSPKRDPTAFRRGGGGLAVPSQEIVSCPPRRCAVWFQRFSHRLLTLFCRNYGEILLSVGRIINPRREHLPTSLMSSLVKATTIRLRYRPFLGVANYNTNTRSRNTERFDGLVISRVISEIPQCKDNQTIQAKVANTR